jgi:toxin-antitoxin system PIN domain toxin
MRPALLDVNVLIALIDPSHEFHDPAHEWFAGNRRFGWATCPITENACLRILSRPAYPYLGLTADEIRGILTKFCDHEGHSFWPDSVSLLDSSRFDLAGAGSKDLTDLYLLGVAAARKGRLATFDRKIRWKSVTGVRADALEVIGSLK